MSHCGGYYMGKRYIDGCVQSCYDDACNRAAMIAAPSPAWPIASSLVIGATLLFILFT